VSDANFWLLMVVVVSAVGLAAGIVVAVLKDRQW
jgi:hypothetical protein